MGHLGSITAKYYLLHHKYKFGYLYRIHIQMYLRASPILIFGPYPLSIATTLVWPTGFKRFLQGSVLYKLMMGWNYHFSRVVFILVYSRDCTSIAYFHAFMDNGVFFLFVFIGASEEPSTVPFVWSCNKCNWFRSFSWGELVICHISFLLVICYLLLVIVIWLAANFQELCSAANLWVILFDLDFILRPNWHVSSLVTLQSTPSAALLVVIASTRFLFRHFGHPIFG